VSLGSKVKVNGNLKKLKQAEQSSLFLLNRHLGVHHVLEARPNFEVP
jgi:hypothetical protein